MWPPTHLTVMTPTLPPTLPLRALRCAVALVLTWALLPISSTAQSFEETWIEFLQERKVSNIKGLGKPDKATDQQDYAKWLLMNANSRFCQSDPARAEELTTELLDMGTEVYDGIGGFTPRLEYLQEGFEAYDTVDELWRGFLGGAGADVERLQAVETVKRLCEKATMAKYTFMLAEGYYCRGEVEEARDIFENRTLRLAEKTTLRVEDVEGLAPRVATYKKLFAGLRALDAAWESYLDTGESPGFERELPVVSCYTTPNLKAYVLRGLASPCTQGADMLGRIAELTGGRDELTDPDLEAGLDDLRARVGTVDGRRADLEAAWAHFIANDKVSPDLAYGYDYCEPEPLVRAYLLDGYTFVCDYAEFALEQVDSLRRATRVKLSGETREKMRELAKRRDEYIANGASIDEVWGFFVANDDQLLQDYTSTDRYCDHVQEVKDWTMRGLTTSCENAPGYLELIDEFSANFEFEFFPELECRIQKLRIRIWECRHQLLRDLAEAEAAASAQDAAARLAELMVEYEMPERPAECEAQE